MHRGAPAELMAAVRKGSWGRRVLLLEAVERWVC